MSLSAEAKQRLTHAVGSSTAGAEVAAAIDASGSGPAANVAAFGATTNLPAAACAGGASPSATNVNAAIDAVSAVAESRLDAAESKINALISAMQAAGLML